MPSLLRTNRRQVCFCCIYTLVCLLLSLNPSAATFNPLYNPQQHQSYYSYQEEQGYYESPNINAPRGGSTMTVAEPQPVEPVQQEQPFQPPKILLKHMSMALRLTSEWNRRLVAGVKGLRFFGINKRRNDSSQQYQQYDSQPVNINPNRSWNPPIKGGDFDEDEDLTIFHAKTPRESNSDERRRGVAHWGPELLPYLEHVVDLLGISSNGVEIPLAMIYLDRACSVETIRSNGCPPCPFCVPRTVHRLSLVALLLATQAVNNENKSIDEYIGVVEESLGIPRDQLDLMVEWMKCALGDDGLFVTVGQMKSWSYTWDSIFFPNRQQTLQQPPQAMQIQSQPNYYQGP